MRQFLLLRLSPVIENFSSVSTTPCSLHPYHLDIITNLFSCYPGNPFLHRYHIHPLFYCAYSVLVTKQRTKCTCNYHCSCCVSCLVHLPSHTASGRWQWLHMAGHKLTMTSINSRDLDKVPTCFVCALLKCQSMCVHYWSVRVCVCTIELPFVF